MKRRSSADRSKDVGESFMRLLTIDVINAQNRWQQEDNQSARRDLIRAMFAAIEGFVWEYREYVRSFIRDVSTNTPSAEAALSEASYSVSPTGKIVSQTRHIPLPSMFRMVTRLAERHFESPKIDFNHDGWGQFQKAIKIRNRVTHPKGTSDLEITLSDIATSETGFFWIFEAIQTVMKAINIRIHEDSEALSLLLLALQSGDQTALNLYNKAKAALDPDSDFGGDPQ